jgi:hypothetical protein
MALLVYPRKSKGFFGSIDGLEEADYGFLVGVLVNNTSKTREMFFTNTLVNKIWNAVARSMT